MQNKDGVRCFTDGCTGNIKLALELQCDMGTEISRRELLRLPDEPKRAAHPPPQAEPKKARKQKGAQKAPAADAGMLMLCMHQQPCNPCTVQMQQVGGACFCHDASPLLTSLLDCFGQDAS